MGTDFPFAGDFVLHSDVDSVREREKWLELRRTAITASDVHAMLGNDRLKTRVELAREKLTGASPPPDPTRIPGRVRYTVEEIEAMGVAGSFFETVNFQYFCMCAGLQGDVTHHLATSGALGATVDAFVRPGVPTPHVAVEWSTGLPRAITRPTVCEMKNKQAKALGGLRRGLPDYHWTQVQAQMEVLDQDEALWVAKIDSWRVIVHTVPRDRAFGQRIREEAVRFMANLEAIAAGDAQEDRVWEPQMIQDLTTPNGIPFE